MNDITDNIPSFPAPQMISQEKLPTPTAPDTTMSSATSYGTVSDIQTFPLSCNSLPNGTDECTSNCLENGDPPCSSQADGKNTSVTLLPSNVSFRQPSSNYSPSSTTHEAISTQVTDRSKSSIFGDGMIKGSVGATQLLRPLAEVLLSNWTSNMRSARSKKPKVLHGNHEKPKERMKSSLLSEKKDVVISPLSLMHECPLEAVETRCREKSSVQKKSTNNTERVQSEPPRSTLSSSETSSRSRHYSLPHQRELDTFSFPAPQWHSRHSSSHLNSDNSVPAIFSNVQDGADLVSQQGPSIQEKQDAQREPFKIKSTPKAVAAAAATTTKHSTCTNKLNGAESANANKQKHQTGENQQKTLDHTKIVSKDQKCSVTQAADQLSTTLPSAFLGMKNEKMASTQRNDKVFTSRAQATQFSRVHQEGEEIAKLKKENEKLLQLKLELEEKLMEQSKAFGEKMEASKKKHEEEVKQLNKTTDALVEDLMKQISSKNKEVEDATLSTKELLRLTEEFDKEKESLKDELEKSLKKSQIRKVNLVKLRWKLVSLEIKNSGIRRKLEVCSRECQNSHRREVALMQKWNAMHEALLTKLEQLDNATERIGQSISTKQSPQAKDEQNTPLRNHPEAVETSLSNSSDEQHQFVLIEGKETPLVAPVNPQLESQTQSDVMHSMTESPRSDLMNRCATGTSTVNTTNENVEGTRLEETDYNNCDHQITQTSASLLSRTANCSVDNVAKKVKSLDQASEDSPSASPSSKGAELHERKNSEEQMLSPNGEACKKSVESNREALIQAHRTLVENLKHIDLLMNRTEDAVITLLQLRNNQKENVEIVDSIATVTKLAQFFVDELNLFLNPLRHSQQNQLHEATNAKTSKDLRSPDIIKLEATSETLTPHSQTGTTETETGCTQLESYEIRNVRLIAGKTTCVNSNCHRQCWRSVKNKPLFKEVLKETKYRWEIWKDLREKQVTEFVESRNHPRWNKEVSYLSSMIHYGPYAESLNHQRSFPLGRDVDNVVIVGSSWNSIEMWLKHLSREERDFVCSMIPPIDSRLIADVEAWKSVFEESADDGQVLRLTQLIDEKSFKEMKMQGKQFMPTTDTFKYLVEYLALSMQPNQKSVVVVCSYMCHLSPQDLQYLGYMSQTKKTRSLGSSYIQDTTEFYSGTSHYIQENNMFPSPFDHSSLSKETSDSEGSQILLSDFISTSDSVPNQFHIQTISIQSLLKLSQLMKEGSELEIILDSGGAGIEVYWGMTKGIKDRVYLDQLDQTARVISNHAVKGGTVSIKRLLPLKLSDPRGCGQREIDLCQIIRTIDRIYDGDVHLMCNFE